MPTLFGDLFRNLFKGPVTRPYPYQVRDPFPASRGALVVDINRCVFCTLCEKKCPANAITVTRKTKTLVLDPYRCIICAACVEVCPEECLSLDPQHRKPA
jgi:ech hydrogenase subunit F